MAYGERLQREEEQISQESGRARPTGRPHRHPMEQLGLEARVRRPRTPLLVDRPNTGSTVVDRRQHGAEPELFREPRDAPELLDIGAPH